MRLTVEALEKQLTQRKIATCYLLVSDEYFLLQETRDSIWQVANTQGFSDRQIWEVTPRLDWEQLRLRNSYSDLFHRAFIELRWVRPLAAEVGEKLQQIVKALTAIPSLGPTIVISCAQGTAKVQQSSWFQALALMTTFVMIEKPSASHLPQWINKQLQRVGLSLTREATLELIQCVEGNLLAARQTIQKLALIYEAFEAPLSVKQLGVALENQATFELFHLTDAVLQGQLTRCMRIIKHIQVTHTPPALVLGYLLKVLRIVAGLRYGLDHQRSLPELFQEYGVWPKQQAGFKQAVQRLQSEDIVVLFSLAHQVDRCIKGAASTSGWSSLQKLSLYLGGYRDSLIA
jgi:DNA polymerase-3 subunit delta